MEERVVDLVFARLEAHLAAIERVDWDYFASLRYRSEGRQAVSDLYRLRRHIEALNA